MTEDPDKDRTYTERLALRPVCFEDAELLFELDSDAEVRRFVNAGPPDLARIREATLPALISYWAPETGSGAWTAELQPGDEFVGWFMLRSSGVARGLELGFRLRRAHWGKGIATEGARALTSRAFATGNVSEILAVALVDNLASCRVLEKLGFQRMERVMHMAPNASAEPASGRPAWRYALVPPGARLPIEAERELAPDGPLRGPQVK